MKTTFALITKSLTVFLLGFVINQQNTKATQLSVQNDEIKCTLREIIEYEQTAPNTDIIYIIKIEDNDGVYQFRIAALSKDIFPVFIRGSKDSLVGYLDYQGYEMIVYSKSDVSKLFKKTNSEKEFSYLKAAPIKKGEDWEPPMIIEPTVWVYNLVGEKMVLEKAGYFKLLD